MKYVLTVSQQNSKPQLFMRINENEDYSFPWLTIRNVSKEVDESLR